jgi:hypothetical protein
MNEKENAFSLSLYGSWPLFCFRFWVD